jgi:hypothetical protein
LKAVRVDKEDPLGTFVIILVRVSDEESKSLTVQSEESFDDGFSPKDPEKLGSDFEDTVLKHILPKEEKKEEKKSALLVTETQPRQLPPQHQPSQQPNPLRDPFSGVGSSDLDPFGRIGSGGMLMDPFHPQGGRGGFPGPRFDPPGPGFLPGRGRGGGQGPQFPGRRNFGDEMPPPGFDNMFM